MSLRMLWMLNWEHTWRSHNDFLFRHKRMHSLCVHFCNWPEVYTSNTKPLAEQFEWLILLCVTKWRISGSFNLQTHFARLQEITLMSVASSWQTMAAQDLSILTASDKNGAQRTRKGCCIVNNWYYITPKHFKCWLYDCFCETAWSKAVHLI